MEESCNWKMVQSMVTATNYVTARAEFSLRGTLDSLGIFATFSSDIGENQKKSYHLSVEPPDGTEPYGRSGPGYCAA